ncbi:JmjC domain-containing protein [Rhizobium ruizarguesonis]
MSEQGFLAQIMGKSEAQVFLSDYWGRRVRHWPAGNSGFGDFGIRLDDFEGTLRTLNRAHEGWLHFADQGLRAVPPDFAGREGFLDMRKVASALSSGQTLYLTKADLAMPALALACSGLAHDLAAFGITLREKIGAHVFLTPRQSQGFAPHRDSHASLILQCEGRKHWEIYVPRDVNARAHRPGSVGDAVLAEHEKVELTLEEGDLLYMPEWWPHAARASQSHSLHVTLRIFPLRYCDVVSELVGLSDIFAAALPTHTSPNAATVTILSDVFTSPGLRKDIAAHLAAAWAAAVSTPKSTSDAGCLKRAVAAEELDLSTLLVRDPGAPCDVLTDGGTAELVFSGNVVRGPDLFAPVFDYVVRNARFRPCDLPEIDAGYDKLDVSRRLVRDGLMGVERTT